MTARGSEKENKQTQKDIYGRNKIEENMIMGRYR
jgi:hypothetical protein